MVHGVLNLIEVQYASL